MGPEDYPLLKAHNESELKVLLASIDAIGEPYEYFRFLQETMLMAFENAGKPLEVTSTVDNPIIFALISTTGAFSIAKTAMDQSLRGCPVVGLAMSRFLSELNQSTQYLVRHPGLIDGYLEGKVKLERVLKFAEEERTERTGIFGQFWGLQSRFSHASQDFLALAFETKENWMKSKLFVYNESLLRDVAYGIMGSLFVQYMIFRIATRGHLAIEGELQKRDKYIFQPQNVRKYLGFDSIRDDFLDEGYRWLGGEQSEDR
jgi:hypothetical protein